MASNIGIREGVVIKFAPVKPLDQLMNENKDKIIISENGFVSLNLNSRRVQESITKQINKLKDLKL